MVATFETLIARNRRISLLLVMTVFVLLALMGGCTGAALEAGNSDNLWPAALLGAGIGAALAGAGAIVSYFWGGAIVPFISGARRIEPFEDAVLFNVVEEMAVAAGIPMPKLYVIFDESPNAFASGRDPEHAVIGITTGLRKKLTRDELQGVVAHELAHIKNRDTLLMMLVGVFAGVIVLIADFCIRRLLDTILWRGRSQSTARRFRFWSFLWAAAGAALLAWIAPLFAKLLQLAVSRRREYLADATAVQFSRNPLALASALKKIAMDLAPLQCDNRATEHLFIVNPNPRRKRINFSRDSIWSTHPPVIDRIARLRRLAGEAG